MSSLAQTLTPVICSSERNLMMYGKPPSPPFQGLHELPYLNGHKNPDKWSQAMQKKTKKVIVPLVFQHKVLMSLSKQHRLAGWQGIDFTSKVACRWHWAINTCKQKCKHWQKLHCNIWMFATFVVILQEWRITQKCFQFVEAPKSFLIKHWLGFNFCSGY